MQGQSSRGRKSPTSKSLASHCLPSYCARGQDKDVVGYANATNNNITRMGKFGVLDSGLNEIRMQAPSGEVGLSQDEDVMPWLNYGMDESLPHEYSSDFLHELSGLTMNDLPPSNNFSLLDRRSNFNQVFRDSHKNYARHVSNSEQGFLSKGSSAAARGEIETPGPKASTSQFYQPPSHQCQTSFASVRWRLSDITENNASNATQHAPCGEITQIFPSASGGFSSLNLDKQDPIMPSSSSTIMNFSHFARPAAIVKANLQNIGWSSSRSEGIGDKNKGAAPTASNPPESTKVGFSGECPKESTLHKQQVMEPSKADLKQLEPKSLEGNATVSKQSDPARKEDVSKIDQTSNLLLCASSNKEQEAVEKNMEPAVASSSVCSGNGAERGSDDPNQNLKRKRRDTEDSECHSEVNVLELHFRTCLLIILLMFVVSSINQKIKFYLQDVEEVSAGVKKAAPTRGAKRSRSAEVHNLSERVSEDQLLFV